MSALGGLIGGIFGLGSTAMSNKAQKKENEKNRLFNAQQAEIQRNWLSQENEINRNFQSKEAELAFERQAEFYQQNQSIGAQIRQYKENGLNPALLAGGVSPAASAPSTTTPAGSAPSGGAAASASGIGSMKSFDFMKEAISVAKLGEELKLMKAETRERNAKALLDEIDSITRNEINESTIAESYAAVRNSDADTAVKERMVDKISADILSTEKDIEVKSAQIAHLSEQILTSQQSRKVMAAQIEQIGASIANLEADTEYKYSLSSLTAAQIVTETYKRNNLESDTLLNAAMRVTEVAKRTSLFAQSKKDSKQAALAESETALNKFELALRDANSSMFNRGWHKGLREVKFTLDCLLGWFSGNASFSRVITGKKN